MSLLRQPLLVLDTETSGLPKHRWAAPIEVACIALDLEGQEWASWESLVRPAVELPSEAEEALRCNHITREQLADAPPLDQVLLDYSEWVRRYELDGVLVSSFNIDFDRTMMNRLRWVLPWSDRCIMLEAHRRMNADASYDGFRWDNGELKWPSLSEAAAYFKVAVEEPQHRALGDARTAAGIVRAIAGRRVA